MKEIMLKRLAEIDSKPIKKCVVDLETYDMINPYAVGFYDGKTMAVFDGDDCIQQFLDLFLTKKYRNYVCFAHNGGKFDFTFIQEHMRKNRYFGKYTLKPIITNKMIQITIYDGNRNRWVLRDSTAFFTDSLKNVARNFQVENQKGEMDHNKVNFWNWRNLTDEWKPYLIKDCKSLYEIMEKFELYLIENYKVNLRKVISTAQLAMTIYRRRFLPHAIPTYEAYEKDIRQAYKGGRVEVIQHYAENVKHYDVNSLYPYVMRKYPMPVGRPYLQEIKISDFGIVFAKVTCPKDLKIPLLCTKREDGKLIFPTGTFSGWFCTPELQKAKQIGYKIEIEHGYKFSKSYLFDDYIDHSYKLKKQSEDGSVSYTLAKLLMNSLYGKFGQKREKSQYVMNPTEDIDLEKVTFFGDDEIYVKKTVSQSAHILPAIAAFVTTYARLELYSWVEKCNEVYYFDTDSIFTDTVLPTSKDIGGLKLEGEYEEASFLLPKFYGMKHKMNFKNFFQEPFAMPKYTIHTKGFPRTAFNYDQIKQAVFSGDTSKLSWSKMIMASPMESLRRQKKFLSMIKMSRNVKTIYDKRIRVGFTTIPLHVENETFINNNNLIVNNKDGVGKRLHTNIK